MNDPTLIAQVSTDYEDRPPHRGHTVSVSGWNDATVMLVIRSDDRVNEALITPAELRSLADAAEANAHRW